MRAVLKVSPRAASALEEYEAEFARMNSEAARSLENHTNLAKIQDVLQTNVV